MVTDALLDVLNSFLTWVVSVRPTWEVHLPGPVATFISWGKTFDGYLPISEGVTCVLLLLGLVGVMTAWKWTIKLVDWVMDVIP